ncbi:MAG: flagellar basal body P-ring formation chaperone FlgA [Comamonas sp.]
MLVPPSLIALSALALRRCAVVGVAALLAQSAWAQQDGTSQLLQIGQRFLDQALQQDTDKPAGNMPLRMQVQTGQLDSRLRLAACSRVEPYLPSGSRLWGRTRLGLRCLEGAVHWNVFLPITVHAYGPAWVVQTGIPAGKMLTAEDAVQAEVDWAEDSAPVYANAQDWVGQVAARTLNAGQALRQNMLRPPNLFTAGSPVQVMVNGGGFSVSSSGKAMAAAGEGQQVRVRMDNGRLVTGTVNANGVVVVQ